MAYPRWRGEHLAGRYAAGDRQGLPPLARGAHSRPTVAPRRPWPTPAGAGSTLRRRPSACPTRAYPRWRGEHNSKISSRSRDIGLPPLARGALVAAVGGAGGSRPTPAGAGSTRFRALTCGYAVAYPRWRGEHDDSDRSVGMAAGLPPLARGAPIRSSARASTWRPTPAGAGSTSASPSTRGQHAAYPRWRGEHLGMTLAMLEWVGLPPLARGAPWHDARNARGGWAYPRWRGEHIAGLSDCSTSTGLPPLARGARQIADRRKIVTGPTPAGAGSTSHAAP